MLKSILKTSGYIVCLAWTGMVSATGLGGINVSSNLGQPLKAEIELVSVDKADRSSISAKLASAEAFKNAGIEYPYALPKLKFEVVNLENGESHVKVTSVQAVNEPFVTLLVEVSWSSGKLMREYTFLLDPADFKVQEPKAEVVNPIEPLVVTPIAPVPIEPVPAIPQPIAAEPVPTPVPAPVSTPTPISTAEATSPQPVAKPPIPIDTAEAVKLEAVADEDSPVVQDALSKEEAIPVVEAEPVQITVFRGDTLNWIASQTKPADVSLERMLVALYRANSDAFVGKNMNRLKTGKIIRLPDATELEAVKQRDAVKVVHAQVTDWNAYRQQLAAVRIQPGAHPAQQESSGKVTAAVAESAPAAKETAKEVLKLSKGEAPGDKAVGGGKATEQDKKNAREEESIAKTKALKEAQDRTALLEKNVKDLQRLAELKKQGAAAQTPAAAAPAASAPARSVPVVATANASAVVAASAPAAVAPKAKVTLEPKVVTQPSLLDEMLADPVMLAGGAALLLGLAGVGLLLARRGKKSGSVKTAGADKEKKLKTADKQEDVGSVSGRFVAPVVPSPETGDFTKTTAITEPAAHHGSDEVDPIGEADLFLTFGRDAQAEEVLKEAVKTNPGNMPVRLKLLSIYSNRKDTDSFAANARAIKDSGDEAAWNQASALGREVDPGNPLYGGGESGSMHVATTKLDNSEPSVDFDLGFGSKSAAATPVSAYQNSVVVEAPSQERTDILTPEILRTARSAPMDFDVSGSQHGELSTGGPGATASDNLGDMVFDVTSSHPDVSDNGTSSKSASTSSVDDLIFDVTSSKTDLPAVDSRAPATEPAAENSMAFTLDFPSEFKSAPARKAEIPAALGLGEINLNLEGLTSMTPGSAGGVKDENWQEVTTKLDLAKAYQEMGDAAGAKEILEEVLRDGDEQQRASAQTMLQQL